MCLDRRQECTYRELDSLLRPSFFPGAANAPKKAKRARTDEGHSSDSPEMNDHLASSSGPADAFLEPIKGSKSPKHTEDHTQYPVPKVLVSSLLKDPEGQEAQGVSPISSGAVISVSSAEMKLIHNFYRRIGPWVYIGKESTNLSSLTCLMTT